MTAMSTSPGRPADTHEAGLSGQAAEFLVQEQISDGVEMIAGVAHDPAFGPLVLAGLGGTTVEVFGDVAVRITRCPTPMSMLRSLRSYRLLTGPRCWTWRPSPSCCAATLVPDG